MLENKNSKTTILLLKIVIIILLLSLFTSIFAIYSNAGSITDSIYELRNKLWEQGSDSSISNDETLTLNTLIHYAKSGVWGNTCRVNVIDNLNSIHTVQDFKGKCPEGGEFFDNAHAYAIGVVKRMQYSDQTGTRLDNAMGKISSLSGEVISILTGFGFLTSLLVFTVLFVRLAVAPSHQISRRALIVDIITSGASITLLGNLWLVISLFQASFNRFWQSFAVYSKDWRDVANMVLVEYKGIITGISGIAFFIVLGVMIINFMMLALSGGNMQKRSEKIHSITNTAIAAAGLGSVTLLVGFFWNMF